MRRSSATGIVCTPGASLALSASGLTTPFVATMNPEGMILPAVRPNAIDVVAIVSQRVA
jgi:hypothetical protein